MPGKEIQLANMFDSAGPYILVCYQKSFQRWAKKDTKTASFMHFGDIRKVLYNTGNLI